MTRSLLWIDASRWGELLLAAGVGDAGRGLRGAGSSPRLSAPARPAAPAPTRYAPAPVGPPQPAPERQIPPAPEPEGDLEVRLDAFLEWARRAAGANQAFIADTNGLAVANAGADADYIAASASLLSSLSQVRAMLGRPDKGVVSMCLSSTETYTVTETTNDWGRFALCLISGERPDQQVISRIQEALEGAFSMKGAADE